MLNTLTLNFVISKERSSVNNSAAFKTMFKPIAFIIPPMECTALTHLSVHQLPCTPTMETAYLPIFQHVETLILLHPKMTNTFELTLLIRSIIGLTFGPILKKLVATLLLLKEETTGAVTLSFSSKLSTLPMERYMCTSVQVSTTQWNLWTTTNL